MYSQAQNLLVFDPRMLTLWYRDDGGARTLDIELSGTIPGGYQNSTVANCVSVCSTAGYIYAGLEYYGECCMYPFACS